jgi:hypothetical protein
MQISGKQFIIITLLFFLLPFSSNWRLFFFGGQAIGIVEKHKITSPMFNNSERYSIIRYHAEGEDYLIYGPEDVIYPIGKEIKIFFRKSNPSEFVMLTMAGLLLTDKTSLFLVLIILWLAFYLSIRDAQKKRRAKTTLPFSFRKPLKRKSNRQHRPY